jgi:hypothetical protein
MVQALHGAPDPLPMTICVAEGCWSRLACVSTLPFVDELVNNVSPIQHDLKYTQRM